MRVTRCMCVHHVRVGAREGTYLDRDPYSESGPLQEHIVLNRWTNSPPCFGLVAEAGLEFRILIPQVRIL